MASWNAIFHRSGRGSRALGVAVVLALGGVAALAPSSCTLDVTGASAGGGGATSASSTTATTTDASTAVTASASASTSAGSSTGTCGTGPGCTPCTMDPDCGAATFDGCTVSTCVNSLCAPKDTTGQASMTQTPNDCMKSVCGADGKPMMAEDGTDLPADDGNLCTVKSCVAGVPTKTPVAMGTACAKGTCDAVGNCVECTKNSDCKTGASPSCDLPTHTCVSCSDGLKNGMETGVDCGATCGKCNGDPCTKAMDCSGMLCIDSICCASSCGGTCQACNVPGSLGICASVPAGTMDMGTCPAPAMECDGTNGCKTATGKACTQNSECSSNTCLAGFCRAPNGKSCVDNAECASKLCMGGMCSPCANDAACPSKSCVMNVCKAPNGSPCDANGDCVGGKCQGDLCKLDNADPCALGLDCVSGFCSGGACTACASNADCPGSGCGIVPVLGAVCKLPVNAYCEPTLPVGQSCNTGGPGKCTGFPAYCHP
ncbi:MAG: hypothetical protein ABJE95_04755 [Byssovorax sp.]